MSLESDRERSGEPQECVQKCQEWLRWLKEDGGWSAVQAEQESPGVRSCLEQGKDHPGGWCKGP
jgi:hypothetical protein